MKKIHLASIEESLRRIADAVEPRDAPNPPVRDAFKVMGRTAAIIILADEDYDFVHGEMSSMATARNSDGPVMSISWFGIPLMAERDIQGLYEEISVGREIEKENIFLRTALENSNPQLFSRLVKAKKVRP